MRRSIKLTPENVCHFILKAGTRRVDDPMVWAWPSEFTTEVCEALELNVGEALSGRVSEVMEKLELNGIDPSGWTCEIDRGGTINAVEYDVVCILERLGFEDDHRGKYYRRLPYSRCSGSYTLAVHGDHGDIFDFVMTTPITKVPLTSRPTAIVSIEE
jgi:hypothetical protein